MPQMAPINWLSLFMVFSLTLMLFCLMNYYCMLPSYSKKHKYYKTDTNMYNWKW